jgi:threonine/homoserine/homoserine lactone efflux protein
MMAGKETLMPEPHTLALFSGASLALLVIPGPAVLYIVARSVHQGRSAGLVSTLGVETGNLVHVAAATLGVSALLASSALAFSIVKYAGAAYLIVLGARILFGDEPATGPAALPNHRLFRQGVVVAVLNPKTALFFVAFLPQFVDSARGSVPLQIGVLGALFLVLAVISDSVYAVVAGTLGQRLRRVSRSNGTFKRFSGGVYIALGVAAAISGGHDSNAS